MSSRPDKLLVTRLLFLSMFLTRFCQAQTVWQGRVLSGKDQQPIPSAVVTLSRVTNGDTLPVAFVLTNALGQFRLQHADIENIQNMIYYSSIASATLGAPKLLICGAYMANLATGKIR